MTELSDLEPDAAKQLALIDKAAQMQIDRDLRTLERVIDLGDQVAARVISMQASTGSDFTETE